MSILQHIFNVKEYISLFELSQKASYILCAVAVRTADKQASLCANIVHLVLRRVRSFPVSLAYRAVIYLKYRLVSGFDEAGLFEPVYVPSFIPFGAVFEYAVRRILPRSYVARVFSIEERMYIAELGDEVKVPDHVAVRHGDYPCRAAIVDLRERHHAKAVVCREGLEFIRAVIDRCPVVQLLHGLPRLKLCETFIREHIVDRAYHVIQARSVRVGVKIHLEPGENSDAARVLLLKPRELIQVSLCLLTAHAVAFVVRREGMPRAVLEAMDLGLPCVGSNTRGIRDLIDHNGGFICDPKDPNAFSSAFQILFENPDLRAKMGKYNRGKVQAYSSEVVKEELYQIYKEAFGDNEHN